MSRPIQFSDAQAYDQSIGVWSKLVGQEFIEWLAPAPGQRWVDIGCGSGAFTELLVERCAPASIHGVDPSAEQIAYARARESTRPTVFEIGDAMALPYQQGQFDAAVMALVLFFLASPALGVAEMRRVTRKGGTVSAYMWDIPGGGSPSRPFSAEFEARGITPMQPVRSEASTLSAMSAMWHAAGLVDVRTHTITAHRSFPDFDTYWAINAVGPAVAPTLAILSAEQRQDVKRALRATLPADHAGGIIASARINAVCGVVPGD